jgi:hypothetical protein
MDGIQEGIEKRPVLSFLLESKGEELDKAFNEGVSGINIKESRAVWKKFRIENGFSSYADLLTLPSVQHKLKKSEIYTVGLTIQHANVSGIETCAWRGHCTSVCVLDNGNGRYSSVQKARNVKTQFLAKHPTDFLRILGSEIKKHSDENEKVLVRLNVNSDLRWYTNLPTLSNGHPAMPNVHIYDYTKNPAILHGDGMVGRKYRAVYSVNEKSDLARVRSFLTRGGTVAIVTNRKKNGKVLDSYLGIPVVDGDLSDDRYHEHGVWVDLAAKGKARQMPDVGFVKNIY